MNYITIDKDKKITGHYCGDPSYITLNLNEELIEIADPQNQIVVNYYADEYDKEWKLRPLADRIKDGSARWVPENMTQKEGTEELRFKTRIELIREGKEQLEPSEKIEGDTIIEKMPEEKLEDGLISQAEYDAIRQHEIEKQIRNAMPGWLLAGLTWQQMLAEVAKIRSANERSAP